LIANLDKLPVKLMVIRRNLKFMDDQKDRLPGDIFWSTFLEEEGLPASYRDTAEAWFSPLVQSVLRHYNEQTSDAGELSSNYRHTWVSGVREKHFSGAFRSLVKEYL
jgi:hypothetical protein